MISQCTCKFQNHLSKVLLPLCLGEHGSLARGAFSMALTNGFNKSGACIQL